MWRLLLSEEDRAGQQRQVMESLAGEAGEQAPVLGPHLLATSLLLLKSWVLVTEVTGST